MIRARRLGQPANHHQLPSLYKLQAQWDQDRAAQRFAPFRAEVRARARRDLRTLPWLLPLLAVTVTALACLSRGFWTIGV